MLSLFLRIISFFVHFIRTNTYCFLLTSFYFFDSIAFQPVFLLNSRSEYVNKLDLILRTNFVKYFFTQKFIIVVIDLYINNKY